MGRGTKPTKADRLAEKREEQQRKKKDKELAKEEEEKIPIAERLADSRLNLEKKLKKLSDEAALLRQSLSGPGNYNLVQKLEILNRDISLINRDTTRLFARLNPQEFLERFRQSPISSLLYSPYNPPHKQMEDNLKEIRKTYPKGTEFAIRMFVGLILSKDFLGPVSNYIEALRCYHENGKYLPCDCTRTTEGFVLSKERQELKDDLKFVVNDVILQSQLKMITFVFETGKMGDTKSIPNLYCPLSTGMEIL